MVCKFFYTVTVAITIAVVLTNCNDKSRPIINAYVEEHTENWERIKSQVIDTLNTIKVKLQFLNNPYRFNSQNDLAIYIDKYLVFKGNFENILEVSVPDQIFGDRTLPAFSIYDRSNTYHFIHKQSMFLNNEDRYLYVVFCPENELMESCYMFAQKEPLL